MITNDPVPSSQTVQVPVDINECVEVDYRVEFTISNIMKKKVMKPLIILIFQMRNGSCWKCSCTMEKFAELRYHIAIALKSFHNIEMKTFYG